MRTIAVALVMAASIPSSCCAQLSTDARRDKALEAINACLRHDEARSRECRKLKKNLAILMDVYRGGDKSVLPTLFRFTYLTDFYGEALLADPDGFLEAMSQLPDQEQKAVASGIAGGVFGLRNQQRFKAIRKLLQGVPAGSPLQKAAQRCLQPLEVRNASFLVNYFPPQTFTGGASFAVHWYSSEMYALGEKPLWPVAGDKTVYRLSYLPAFHGPSVVTLTLPPNGTNFIAIKSLSSDLLRTQIDQAATVSHDDVARFFIRLEEAHFWEMPTEIQSHGIEGAQWILEGFHDGKYHAVVRWCPAYDRQSPGGVQFADAARMLFELAGHKYYGRC